MREKHGLFCEGRSGRLSHLLLNSCLSVQTVDFLGVVGDFLLHAVVGFTVLLREKSVGVSVRVKEGFCGFPCLCSLVHKLL